MIGPSKSIGEPGRVGWGLAWRSTSVLAEALSGFQRASWLGSRVRRHDGCSNCCPTEATTTRMVRPYRDRIRAWHEQALRDRFPEQRSRLAAAPTSLKQRIASFGLVEFPLHRLRCVEAAHRNRGQTNPGPASFPSRFREVLDVRKDVLGCEM